MELPKEEAGTKKANDLFLLPIGVKIQQLVAKRRNRKSKSRTRRSRSMTSWQTLVLGVSSLLKILQSVLIAGLMLWTKGEMQKVNQPL